MLRWWSTLGLAGLVTLLLVTSTVAGLIGLAHPGSSEVAECTAGACDHAPSAGADAEEHHCDGHGTPGCLAEEAWTVTLQPATIERRVIGNQDPPRALNDAPDPPPARA